MSTQRFLYIVTKAPYSNAVGQEALDAALIGASFDQHVSILFLHDGVFQLAAEQDTSHSGIKQFTKAYRALADFGIENVYCHDLSLAARGLLSSDLMRGITILTSERVKSVIAESDKVFAF